MSAPDRGNPPLTGRAAHGAYPPAKACGCGRRRRTEGSSRGSWAARGGGGRGGAAAGGLGRRAGELEGRRAEHRWREGGGDVVLGRARWLPSSFEAGRRDVSSPAANGEERSDEPTPVPRRGTLARSGVCAIEAGDRDSIEPGELVRTTSGRPGHLDDDRTRPPRRRRPRQALA